MSEEIESETSSDDMQTSAPIKDLLKPKSKHTAGLKRFGKYGLLGALGLFLFLHIYLFILIFLPAPITLNMIMNAEPLKRETVRLSEISPNLIRAVIAAEDTRFCEHKGLDLEALQDAIEDNKTGEGRRGGSTISQQTAKNVIFWNGGGYIRKAGEAYVTLAMELIWSKSKIMEHYLNIAEWGDGIYGAEMAAQIRFNKSASNLNRTEAALLASVLPNPNKWRVDPPGPYVSERVRTVQSRMETVNQQGLASCVIK